MCSNEQIICAYMSYDDVLPMPGKMGGGEK